MENPESETQLQSEKSENLVEETYTETLEQDAGEDISENTGLKLNISDSEILNKPVRHLKLPLSKVMKIMKMDPDVQKVQHDAVFLVTKATEMFIEFISKETNKQLSRNKRKTLMKRDVDVTIESIPQLCFLDGALE